MGTIQQLGAEVLEFPVGEDDAIVGRVVNELGLPRDALVNVLVRDEEALLPRGSTQIEAGDRLHILVRQPARAEVEGLFERWREGPIERAQPPVIAGVRPHRAIFSVLPWPEEAGDPGAPEKVEGATVGRKLRTRRGAPGSLVQLEDGRYAVTGDGIVAVGGAAPGVPLLPRADRARRGPRVARLVAGGRRRALPARGLAGVRARAAQPPSARRSTSRSGAKARGHLVGLVVEQAGEDQRARAARSISSATSQQQRAHQVGGDGVGRGRRLAAQVPALDAVERDAVVARVRHASPRPPRGRSRRR